MPPAGHSRAGRGARALTLRNRAKPRPFPDAGDGWRAPRRIDGGNSAGRACKIVGGWFPSPRRAAAAPSPASPTAPPLARPRPVCEPATYPSEDQPPTILHALLRPRTRHNQHVPANRRRLLHLCRATTVLAI